MPKVILTPTEVDQIVGALRFRALKDNGLMYTECNELRALALKLLSAYPNLEVVPVTEEPANA